MKRPNLALAECPKPDPGELQAFEQSRDILLIAGEAIERLGDDDVEGKAVKVALTPKVTMRAFRSDSRRSRRALYAGEGFRRD